MRLMMILFATILPMFANSGTIMIEIAYKGEQYNIIRAWKIEQTLPCTMSTFKESDDDIIIKIKDKNASVVGEIRVNNPKIVRGILPQNNNSQGHKNIIKNKGTIIVRYPYKEGLKYLNIINAKESSDGNKLKRTPLRDIDFGILLE